MCHPRTTHYFTAPLSLPDSLSDGVTAVFNVTQSRNPVWFLPPINLDGTVFALTIAKTYQLSKTLKAVGMRSELANLLMRDGQYRDDSSSGPLLTSLSGSIYFA